VITRRDMTIAAVAIGATLAFTAFADSNGVPVSQDGTHSVRRFFKAPTATLDELEVHVTTLPAGELSHPAHKHPNEELVIVKEGTVEVLVNGRLQRLGPGSVIFNAANQMHSLRNVGNSAATYHVINWKSH
jgi:XRE family transcriptional regulator, regulator of sulfur utilization